MRVRHVDRCQLRRNFATQFAIDSPVVVANDFDGKSMENRSKIAFECGSAPNSASRSILGAFLPPFYPLGGASGSFWVPLGDPWGSPGRPWGAPGVPWEGLGPPPGLPGDPPGTHLGPSWAPGSLEAWKTTIFDDSCRDSRCCIVNPYNCRHFSPKSDDSCRDSRCSIANPHNCHHFWWFCK